MTLWNGEEPCISSMLDSFWNGFSFCMKAGKKFKLLLFFCLYFVYGVYSWAQKSAGETSMGISTDSASQHSETQLQRAPNKGSPILLFASLGSLNEIPSKHEILHVQQLNGIASVVYRWLYDIFRLYALVDIYIVLNGLFFQLKCAANNVLTFECYFLYR